MIDADAPIGVGATWSAERALAATGQVSQAPILFEFHNNVMNAGVLFSLPALLSQGLMKALKIYKPLPNGFYGLMQMLLLLAYMALCRIKNPEQLKTCPPGELGKVMGIDRVPEVKCLRKKLSYIIQQEKAKDFGQMLSQEWITESGCLYFYIDGHINVYHGEDAHLPKKFVSREKLCLAGTTEYWVNDEKGLPFMVFHGELNEKLKDALQNKIIPRLIEDTKSLVDEEALQKNPLLPRFTILFDREGYHPAFFQSLWEEHRIAVITYRKNIKDNWDENDFQIIDTEVIGNKVSMLICDKEVSLSGYLFREVRKLSKDTGHQTSILSTNRMIRTEMVAGKMFSRWSQENFFRYMISEFGIDRMIEYGTEPVNENAKVVNPKYSDLTYRIKKKREKKSRIEAKLFAVMDDQFNSAIEITNKLMEKHSDLKEKQDVFEKEIKQLLEQRKNIPARIAIKDMPDAIRYNRLKQESKLFINTIKAIAYRAETVLYNFIKPYYASSEKEGRVIIKEILTSDADISPDYNKNILVVRLHSLSTPRANKAVEELCKILNETETVFPETKLKLIFKTLANQFA